MCLKSLCLLYILGITLKPFYCSSFFHILIHNMKKQFLLITLFISSFSLAFAQVPDLSWAISAGSTSVDKGYGIHVDANGNAYTVGLFNGTVDFDPSTNVYNLTAVGSRDAFILKTDANGNLIWVKNIGSTAEEQAYGIGTDAAGNVYACGYYTGTVDLDPGPNVHNVTAAGIVDIFVVKLDEDGNFIWGQSIGSSYYDIARNLAVDATGNVYVTGTYQGTVDFDSSANDYSLTSVGFFDAFIFKLDTDGNFQWAKSLGGTETDNGNAIALDNSNHVIVVGHFQDQADFDPSSTGTDYISTDGSTDAFVLKLNTDGTFVWAKTFGSDGEDYAWAVDVDASDSIYVSGNYQNTVDFDPSSAATANLSSAGDYDVFVLKLNASGNYVWAKSCGGSDGDQASALAYDATDHALYIAGSFSGTSDYDPGANTASFTSNGGSDAFILKLSETGNYLWATPIGGTSDDAAYTVATNSSGLPYVAGYYNNTVDFDPSSNTHNSTSNGEEDIYIMKFGSTVTGLFDGASATNTMEVFPNPTDGTVAINTTKELTNALLRVTDISGHVITEQTNLNGNYFTFDLSKQKTGVYILEISQDGYLSKTKVVKK
ncbi:MAG: hypothetical protein JWO58_2870 [Chitinophagaceae bacterium]|nr:hypothetical protein [Chitinophagaceae bacterium]